MVTTRPSLLVRVRDPVNHDGWREFFALYEPLLANYARRMGVPESDACDVVQEIFIRLARALPDFEHDPARGRFRTWLYQVSRSAVEDWRRRKRREGKAEDAAREQLTDPDLPADSEEQWLVEHHRRVIEFALERVRDRSNPKTWSCFELHVLRGATAAKVAAELQVSDNAVYANASRILARVRDQCHEYLETLDDEPAGVS